MYQVVEKEIRLSVRNLVEFILRSGSIDNRRTIQVQKEAMQIGSRLHRKIQGRMGSNYRAEVVLKHKIPIGELILILEGRADGIVTENGKVIIDEIKVVFMDFSKLEEAFYVHQAQAVCYGYIYAIQNNLPEITIQLTYCHPETEEIRRFSKIYRKEELTEEFSCYIHEYAKWARFSWEHRNERNKTLNGLQFPYPYRPGQRSLVVASYRAILAKEILFLQASTGIGKTLSVLFPSVIAMGQGYAEKIFYLTAKTITRAVAEEGLCILRKKGAKLSYITITAKEKLCLSEQMDCNPVSCSFADGHFDRVNDAVYDLICHETEITREVLLSYAKKYRVCPFEMCLDVTYWMDAVICDYNYLFDPSVRLQRFFADNEKGDYIFLVDEAHNLVDRAREMYSAVLYKEEFLEAKKLYHELPMVVKKIESCNRKLLELKRECDHWKILPDGTGIGSLLLSLESLYGELTELPEKYPWWTPPKEAGDFFFHIRDFLSVYEMLDENYRVYTEHTEEGHFAVHELCVNPAKRIDACCSQGIATVFFSATFLPIYYYKELLAANSDAKAVYAKSPFDSQKRLLAIGTDVTTRYTRRNEAEYRRYALYLSDVLQAKHGNYLAFFPSYRYMQEVLQQFILPQGYVQVVQDTKMTEEDRENFLQAFRDKTQPTVGFCVIGGIFSEGIDLQKEALIGVIIAGTGLPQVGTRQEILRLFYEEQGKDGYAFAYQYPGTNKVLQAAGRLIRTTDDYGVILLLDERFTKREYREQFPAEWDRWQVMTEKKVSKILSGFWEGLSNILLTDKES